MELPNAGDVLTPIGVGALAVLGGIAKGVQWRDPTTGAVSLPMLISGIATSLVLAAAVRAAGVHYDIEPWIQVAISGVLCYVGPDAILRMAGSLILKRIGMDKPNDKA